MFNRLRHAWRNLLHRDVVEQDLTDEIDAVFGLLVAEKIRSGMSPADARRSARLQLGGTESIRSRFATSAPGRSSPAWHRTCGTEPASSSATPCSQRSPSCHSASASAATPRSSAWSTR